MNIFWAFIIYNVKLLIFAQSVWNIYTTKIKLYINWLKNENKCEKLSIFQYNLFYKLIK